jgi:TolB protein
VLKSFEWSPDSSSIVVVEGPTGITGDLHVVDVAAASETRITMGGDDFHARWSPDGTKLIFSSVRDGNEEIYVANPDGSALVNLTMDPGDDRYPVWAPCPD